MAKWSFHTTKIVLLLITLTKKKRAVREGSGNQGWKRQHFDNGRQIV